MDKKQSVNLAMVGSTTLLMTPRSIKIRELIQFDLGRAGTDI